jgi:predicted nucleotidyltransferase component of viral defense system
VTIAFPQQPELRDLVRRTGIAYEDVVRDVVRLVAIAQLQTTKFLSEDCVLVGGMALRLRGSNRFTIFDTDSSTRRPPADEKDLSDSLAFSADDLEILPEDPTHWTNNNKIKTAKPVKYKAYFAGGSAPFEGEFSLTVNERGLEMPPQWFDLRTFYSGLIFDPVPRIPVMHLDEQTAEKILGWCGNSLAKHYLDLGWIAHELAQELNGTQLREQCERKLKINQALLYGFDQFNELEDLIGPLENPDHYFGPLNRDRDRREAGIQFIEAPLSLDEAKAHVRQRLVPLLRA